MYIKKYVELARYGYMEGCPGCNAARAGSVARAHSSECRVRITTAMEGDESGLVRVTLDHLKRPKRKPESESEQAPRAVRARDTAVAGAGASSSSAGPASMALATVLIIEENMEICELCMNLSAMGEGMVYLQGIGVRLDAGYGHGPADGV